MISWRQAIRVKGKLTESVRIPRGLKDASHDRENRREEMQSSCLLGDKRDGGVLKVLPGTRR